MALTVSLLHKKSSGVTIYKVYCILNLNTKAFSVALPVIQYKKLSERITRTLRTRAVYHDHNEFSFALRDFEQKSYNF